MKLKNKLLIGMVLIGALFFFTVYIGPYSYLMRHVTEKNQTSIKQNETPDQINFSLAKKPAENTTTSARSNADEFSFFLISIFVLILFFIVLTMLFVRFLLLSRLEKLGAKINHINSQHAYAERLSVTKHDELTSLVVQINKMLDLIQSTKAQLENRVHERTLELEKTNVQLKHELSKHQSIEKELVTGKDHLAQLAHYDHLTSLPNRIFFNEILNKALSHAQRHQKIFAFLLIDVDQFKKINETFNNDIGNEVLKEIATRFTTVMRSGDILARLGGDEFVILLNDIEHPKFASSVAGKLLQACAHPFKIENKEFFVTVSIGICIFPHDGASLEDLQKNADIALYTAKQSGGGIFQYFTSQMNQQAYEYIKLESALRKALSNHELVLYYQPKLNLEDGSIAGVEALTRWNHPELGVMSPEKFIPLAEETGLIMQIGEWALREACTTNKHWQNEGYQPITVAVNISPKQFKYQNIVGTISSILSDTKLDPKYLELEITENAVMENIEMTIEKLNAIKAMGVKISIDDFGMGYTSINYLKQFPVDFLKIDQVFVKGIPTNPNDAAITSAVIALAHNLSIKFVGEGVETAEQLQFLADHNCDIVQGYFLSRPLPENKIVLQFVKGV